MHTTLIVIAVIGIVAYVIGRQLLGEPLRGKRVVVLPLILTVIGATDLGHGTTAIGAADIAFIAAAGVLAAGIGVAQGVTMRLENRDGGLWGQMPVRALWLWVALVAGRVALAAAAGASGAHVAASTTPILLTLGINRLAQAAAIGARAVSAGIPFAAEKDGSVLFASAYPTEPGTHWTAAAAGALQAGLAQRGRDRDARRSGRGPR